jgi:diaminopimelate decarboxylase
MQEWFEDHGFQVKVLNTGGGLGVDYHHPDTNAIADFEGYFKVFKDFLNVKPGQEVHFELGRAMVAQCSALVSRVLYVKNGQKKNFLVLDAGMTELIRPMLYQAYQKIENLSRESESQKSEVGSHESGLKTQDLRLRTQDSRLKYDVVGPICESTDCFQKDVELPESFRGDLFAIRTAGAYGEVMASGYNLRDKVQSIYSE